MLNIYAKYITYNIKTSYNLEVRGGLDNIGYIEHLTCLHVGKSYPRIYELGPIVLYSIQCIVYTLDSY